MSGAQEWLSPTRAAYALQSSIWQLLLRVGSHLEAHTGPSRESTPGHHHVLPEGGRWSWCGSTHSPSSQSFRRGTMTPCALTSSAPRQDITASLGVVRPLVRRRQEGSAALEGEASVCQTPVDRRGDSPARAAYACSLARAGDRRLHGLPRRGWAQAGGDHQLGLRHGTKPRRQQWISVDLLEALCGQPSSHRVQ